MTDALKSVDMSATGQRDQLQTLLSRVENIISSFRAPDHNTHDVTQEVQYTEHKSACEKGDNCCRSAVGGTVCKDKRVADASAESLQKITVVCVFERRP